MATTMKEMISDARTRVGVVSPQEAQGSDALILDVREPAELDENGRIAGALHIPRGILETRADDSLPTAEARLIAQRDTGAVHVLCASGGRAALAADVLQKMGYDAHLIEGGIGAWKAADLPVEG